MERTGHFWPFGICWIQMVIAAEYVVSVRRAAKKGRNSCSVLISVFPVANITKLMFMSCGWSFDMFSFFLSHGRIWNLPFGDPLFYWSHLGLLILICHGSSYFHAITWEELLGFQLSRRFSYLLPLMLNSCASTGLLHVHVWLVCCASMVSWIRLVENVFLLCITIHTYLVLEQQTLPPPPPLGGLPLGSPWWTLKQKWGYR